MEQPRCSARDHSRGNPLRLSKYSSPLHFLFNSHFICRVSLSIHVLPFPARVLNIAELLLPSTVLLPTLKYIPPSSSTTISSSATVDDLTDISVDTAHTAINFRITYIKHYRQVSYTMAKVYTPVSTPIKLTSPPTYRKKTVSPVKTKRFSPYKLPRKSHSALPLQGQPQLNLTSPPPVYGLPSVPDDLEFEYRGEQFVQTAHITLDFSLCRDGEMLVPSFEQLKVIMGLFPTSYDVSCQAPFITVVCQQLPPRPWPVTVAGLALFLTTDEDAKPMNIGIDSGGPFCQVQSVITMWKTPSLDVFKSLFRFFSDLQANIQEIQWLGWCLLVLGDGEPFPDWRKRLPRRINNIRVGYIFEPHLMLERALRTQMPRKDDPDDEEYSELRPGVMLAARMYDDPYAAHPQTTSGICVQAPSGEKYITVAAHGFPGGVDDMVRHPYASSKFFAVVDKAFGMSDIALAIPRISIDGYGPDAVAQPIKYSREPFSVPGEEPSKHFRELLNVEKLRPGDLLTMDDPFNGRVQGIHAKVSIRRIPTDEPNDSVQYVIGSFTYFGTGDGVLYDGSCGGVVWTDEYDVVGQFRMVEKNGPLSYCPAFSTLRELGYKISEIK